MSLPLLEMLTSSNNTGKGSGSIAGVSKQEGTQTPLFLNPAAPFLKDAHLFCLLFLS